LKEIFEFLISSLKALALSGGHPIQNEEVTIAIQSYEET